jgi:uncharacterized protein YegL
MSKTTHIICILDRSGSMSTLTESVISNFNTFLEEQKSVEGKAKLTLVLFDDRYEVVYDEVKLKDVKPLTTDTYFTRGMTAMNDAIGRTVSSKINKKKAIVLIHTDGFENASTEYSAKAVKELVDKQKEKWEFIFVGADIDAETVGNDLGITKTIKTSKSVNDLQDSYSVFSYTTAAYRSNDDVDKVLMQSDLDVKLKG